MDEHTVAYAIEEDEASADYEVTRENARMLASVRDAGGKPLKLVPLYAPDFETVEAAVSRQWPSGRSRFNEDSFVAGYIGYYATDRCILMAQFGDEQADKAAFDVLAQAYPHHHIMQIATDGLANGGGTIHCATQQQIA